MTRRLEDTAYYEVYGSSGKIYGVTLERLKNDINGHPRYKAGIIAPDLECVINYTFTGHYDRERGEAEWIVKQHEKAAIK